MKQKIALISGAIILIAVIVSLSFYLRDPLQGKWRSDKGDIYGLLEVKGAPFFMIIGQETFEFQNKEYPIIERSLQEDGRIFIRTNDFTLKIKFREDGNIIFSFPGIGARYYKKAN